jgi:probable rRNA maturation factor
VLKTLSLERARYPLELSVTFVSDNKIKRLNKLYLGKNEATDVLAFDLSGSGARSAVADIIISTDTASRQARQYATSALFEVYLYLVHGLLHILGYSDDTESGYLKMQKRCEYILNKLNLS